RGAWRWIRETRPEDQMRPLDAQTVEQQLRDAIDAGDENEIMRLGMLLDELAPLKRPPSLAAAALWYAEQGLHVFPIMPGSKYPYGRSHGFKDATNDVNQVRTWWSQAPESNIGLATGHVVDIVDIDGPKGHASMYAKWAMIDSLNIIGTVSTPRPGGLHFYVPAAG